MEGGNTNPAETNPSASVPENAADAPAFASLDDRALPGIRDAASEAAGAVKDAAANIGSIDGHFTELNLSERPEASPDLGAAPEGLEYKPFQFHEKSFGEAAKDKLDRGVESAKSALSRVGKTFGAYWGKAKQGVADFGEAVNAKADQAAEAVFGAAERAYDLAAAAPEWVSGRIEAARAGAAKFYEENLTMDGRLKSFAERIGLREDNMPPLKSPELRQSILGLGENEVAMGEMATGFHVFNTVREYRQRQEDIRQRYLAQEQGDAEQSAFETQQDAQGLAEHGVEYVESQIDEAKIGQLLTLARELGIQIDEGRVRREIEARSEVGHQIPLPRVQFINTAPKPPHAPEVAQEQEPSGPFLVVDNTVPAETENEVGAAEQDAAQEEPAHGQEAQAEDLEQAKEKMVAAAANFDELIETIDKIGPVQGSDRMYSATFLKSLITVVRESPYLLNDVTRTYGLRDKVEELLKKEPPAELGRAA